MSISKRNLANLTSFLIKKRTEIDSPVVGFEPGVFWLSNDGNAEKLIKHFDERFVSIL